jgi:thiol-disulfide isomerase/thioredoxin
MADSPGIESVVGSLPASSRRQFLQGAAGVLAFPFVVPGAALGKDGATAASERITVGVIGTGNRGTDDMMGVMQSPLSQVVAVCDCRRPRLEEAGKRVERVYSERDNRGSYGGCKAYHDFREVIDRKDVDALIVTVPDHFWYRGCGWCIKAMPQLNALAEDFAGRPVAVLGMNTDGNEADAKFVVDAMGLKYATLRAKGIPEKYGVQGFPTLILIDGEGKVRDMHVGYSPTLRAELAKAIEGLLPPK